jgi:hypothetical protein
LMGHKPVADKDPPERSGRRPVHAAGAASSS